MKKQDLTTGLASTYGKERAEEMIGEIIAEAGLPVKEEYSRQELLQICDFMVSSSDRFQQMMGGFLKARVLLLKE
jgi:hypothetical protein